MTLVVGATGSLGGRVVKTLLANGKRVRALVRETADISPLPAQVEIVSGDMLDPSSVKRAMAGASIVVTTAAGYTRRSKGESQASVDDLGNRNLIDAAREANIGLFVFTSVLTCEKARDVPQFWQKKLIEDYLEMLREYPTMNAYWQSKVPDFENVTVPAYITGGLSHVHMMGAINGYRGISSAHKWLRVHRDFEWPDSYSWWNVEDLTRFFDRYLKGIRNGWEMTPEVRLDIMDAYEYDAQTSRPEDDFPIARTEYTKFYLDAAAGQLRDAPGATSASASYDPDSGEANFDITFTEDTEIAGFIKAHLWVEADGHDEMDLFLTVLKLGTDGQWLPTSVLGLLHPGAWGRLRVSHRDLDEKLSTDFQPVQSHQSERKLAPGEIVPVDISFYPHARIWHAGETLRLRVTGRYIREFWFEPFSWDTDNQGRHVIHAGGEHNSYLQLPVIPPKHRSGSYVYR